MSTSTIFALRKRFILALVYSIALAGCGTSLPKDGTTTPVPAWARRETAPLPVRSHDFVQLVLARAQPGREADFDRWYDMYLRQSVRIPGVLTARSYRVLPIGAIGPTLPRSVTLYALDGRKAADFDVETAQSLKKDALNHSDAVDYNAVVTVRMRPWGSLLWANELKGADSTAIGAGPIQFYKFVVFSDPASPSEEQAYNDWYDHQHLPDVLRVPGFVSAQRFITVSGSKNNSLPRYLVIFTLRSGDLAATNAEIGRRIHAGITVLSPTMVHGVGAFMAPSSPPPRAPSSRSAPSR
jgi:hypothetical protein